MTFRKNGSCEQVFEKSGDNVNNIGKPCCPAFKEVADIFGGLYFSVCACIDMLGIGDGFVTHSDLLLLYIVSQIRISCILIISKL